MNLVQKTGRTMIQVALAGLSAASTQGKRLRRMLDQERCLQMSSRQATQRAK